MRSKMKTITATILLVVMMATMLVPIASAENIGIAPMNANYKTLEVKDGNGSETFTGGPGPLEVVVSNYQVKTKLTLNAGYYPEIILHSAGNRVSRVEATIYSNSSLTAPIYTYFIDLKYLITI